MNLNFNNINLSNLQFTDPIINNDLYESYVYYNNNDEPNQIIFKTGNMRIININQINNKYQLIVQFIKDYDKFYDFIYNLDKTIISNVFDNSQYWFNNKANIHVLNNMFKPSINVPINLHSFPTMTLYINNNCSIIDINGDEIPIEDLQPNYEINMVIHVDKILFYSNKYVLNYNVHLINIQKYCCQSDTYDFIDSPINPSIKADI
jgi:hypothetical protein